MVSRNIERGMDMAKFTLYEKMFEGLREPKFAFDAKDEQEAVRKARGWARYHGMSHTDVSVKPSTENEAKNWLHNEYVD